MAKRSKTPKTCKTLSSYARKGKVPFTYSADLRKKANHAAAAVAERQAALLAVTERRAARGQSVEHVDS